MIVSIDFTDFKQSILIVPVEAVLVALVIGLLSLMLYSVRLSCLVDKPFMHSFWIVCFGFGANNILPFRMGDILKIYFARKNYQFSASKLLFVKIMEKFFDLSFLLLIGFVALFMGVVAIGGDYLLRLSVLMLVIVIAAVFALFLIRRELKLILWLRQNTIIDRLLSQFEEIFVNPALKWALAITAGIWFVTVLLMYTYTSMVLTGYELGLNDAFALVFITTLSLGLPTAPAGLGVFEAVVVFYLSKFHFVPEGTALAVALILHMATALPQILLMFAALVVSRLEEQRVKSPTCRIAR